MPSMDHWPVWKRIRQRRDHSWHSSRNIWPIVLSFVESQVEERFVHPIEEDRCRWKNFMGSCSLVSLLLNTIECLLHRPNARNRSDHLFHPIGYASEVHLFQPPFQCTTNLDFVDRWFRVFHEYWIHSPGESMPSQQKRRYSLSLSTRKRCWPV